MRKIQLLVLLFALPFITTAQFKLNDVMKEAKDVTGGKKKLSNDEVISGLKEALNVGTNNSTASASKVDGYLKNDKIKIPFPKEAEQMESTLRKVGMNKEVDDFVTSMNRGAEEAAKNAAPIFLNAIKGMSIGDGMTILKGSDSAATGYLRKQTTADLTVKFMPVIKAALEKVEVTKYWEPLVKRYNQIPFVTKQNPKLDEYVNSKALDGLFYLISQEELKIRKDPAARVTDLLKKVFGS
jgi:hypothetical protein